MSNTKSIFVKEITCMYVLVFLCDGSPRPLLRFKMLCCLSALPFFTCISNIMHVTKVGSTC